MGQWLSTGTAEPDPATDSTSTSTSTAAARALCAPIALAPLMARDMASPVPEAAAMRDALKRHGFFVLGTADDERLAGVLARAREVWRCISTRILG